jgi:hypothetical protein
MEKGGLHHSVGPEGRSARSPRLRSECVRWFRESSGCDRTSRADRSYRSGGNHVNGNVSTKCRTNTTRRSLTDPNTPTANANPTPSRPRTPRDLFSGGGLVGLCGGPPLAFAREQLEDKKPHSDDDERVGEVEIGP